MIIHQTATLRLNSMMYMKEGVEGYTISTRKRMLEALAIANKAGRFSVLEKEEGNTLHKGRIVNIEFLGRRRLTRAELDNLPFDPDEGDRYQEESVTYSFRRWQKEGRPLKLRLERREEYLTDLHL